MFVKEITVMNFENCFPLWNDLNTTQKKIISDNLITQYVKKGTIIHNGNLDCTGLLLVKSGQLRTYILSDEGREITLYRLFDMDMCLLSASCIIRSIQFEVTARLNSNYQDVSGSTIPRGVLALPKPFC